MHTPHLIGALRRPFGSRPRLGVRHDHVPAPLRSDSWKGTQTAIRSFMAQDDSGAAPVAQAIGSFAAGTPVAQCTRRPDDPCRHRPAPATRGAKGGEKRPIAAEPAYLSAHNPAHHCHALTAIRGRSLGDCGLLLFGVCLFATSWLILSESHGKSGRIPRKGQ